MTACIGWLASPPCPTHGITHGCRHGERHGGKWHECECGSKVPQSSKNLLPKSCVSHSPVSQRNDPGVALTTPGLASTLEVPT